ncbi:MAG: hypothetical protein IPM71_13750 [Bacteroidota bacterium]|nr:MAG: hypothetical protein IPM71_13750 [Bacteroidota bacterium]
MLKQIIGLYQLITGLFGFIFVLASALLNQNLAMMRLVQGQVFAGVILFGLLAWTGWGVLNSTNKSIGYSKVLQSLQIFSFSISGTLYKFSAGAFISFGYANGGLIKHFSLMPIDFALASGTDNSFSLVIYLVPLLILIALIKIK